MAKGFALYIMYEHEKVEKQLLYDAKLKAQRRLEELDSEEQEQLFENYYQEE